MMGTGAGMGWMWILGLLVIVGLTLLVVVVVRAVGGGVHRGAAPTDADDRPGRSRAREVLDERYARGELTTEEYRERLTALEEHE